MHEKKDVLFDKNQELNIELGINKNYEKKLKEKCIIEAKILDKRKRLDILLNEINGEELCILKDKINELMNKKNNVYDIDLTYEEYKKEMDKLETDYNKINIDEDPNKQYERINQEYLIKYEMMNKNINIIEYELKNINIKKIGKETKEELIKLTNLVKIDTLENDINELENRTNLKEEYEIYIQQKNELTKKESLLKELEKYEYNPECHICCKNAKVKDLKKLSEEIKELKIIISNDLVDKMKDYKEDEKELILKKEELKKINNININIKYLELLENKKQEEEQWKNNNNCYRFFIKN